MRVMTPEQFEVERERKIVAAMAVAAERLAALPVERREFIEGLMVDAGPFLERVFVSPDDGHGRQTAFIATPEELAQWKAGIRAE